MNKNLITLLSLLKVASIENKETILIPLKKANNKLLIALYKQGLIQNFTQVNSLSLSVPKTLIRLRYSFNKSLCKNIKLLSKPSVYLYLNYESICRLYDKRHILFLSTNKGILTNFECKVLRVGGIALFTC
jgi:small subunit ribosomal protein S8